MRYKYNSIYRHRWKDTGDKNNPLTFADKAPKRGGKVVGPVLCYTQKNPLASIGLHGFSLANNKLTRNTINALKMDAKYHHKP